MKKMKKDEKDQCIGMNKRQKLRIANEYRYSLKSNFLGVNGLIVVIYLYKDDNAQWYKSRRYFIKGYF